jgi:hypothetical protein
VKDPITRRVALALLALVALVVALNLLAAGLDDAVGGNEPSGEPGSAYATSPSGLGGYAQLLARYGYPIQRQRGSLADADLDPDGTLFVVGSPDTPVLTDDEIDSITGFVDAGGRAVLVGLDADAVRAIAGVDIDMMRGRTVYTSFAGELGDLSAVRSAGLVAYNTTRADVTVLAHDREQALLVAARAGAGDVWVLAESAPIENRLLVEADNAAFGLTLPGAADRPVTFAEGIHGYGEESGVAAIPTEWKVAFAGLALAVLVFAWARGRRLGPPDQPNRTLPPPRAAYIDALAGSLARTNDPAAALEGLTTWTRERVAQRGGLGATVETDELEHAARDLGFDDAEVAALRHPPRTDTEVLALGRAVARATGGTPG